MKKAWICGVFLSVLSVIFSYSFVFAAPTPSHVVTTNPTLLTAKNKGGTDFDSSQNSDALKAVDKALDEVEKKQTSKQPVTTDTQPVKTGDGLVKMSGHTRMAAGMNGQDFIVNDANADLQERNSRYLFGERLNNTYDPAIYSQFLLNLDVALCDQCTLYTQIVADPWSWVGSSSEILQTSDIGGEEIRYKLKYFGAFNSVINEIHRTNTTDSVAFPLIKVHDGHTTSVVAHGFYGYNPGTGGIPFTIPETDLNYEFRPFRKLWMDYAEDNWKLRLFALADEKQALSTDDPLELSNHKDYWQQSPWLYQYTPVQFFSDGSLKRGYYNDSLSFLARDSDGNRLVLLRGASLEADWGDTYFTGTVAAPFTPWDEDYFGADNIPGAFRVRHQITDKLMLGGIYTFRSGLINNSVADLNQVIGVDTKYSVNKSTELKGEAAVSYRDRDMLTNEVIRGHDEGYAYKAAIDSSYDHDKVDGHTELHLSYTQMDALFDPTLSRYVNTRDDHFWGNHLTFQEYDADMEHFRIGDGIDRNRMVVRARWKEKLFKDRFQNLIDIRNVHKTSNTAYLETVFRDEVSYVFTPKLTGKAMFRWQGFPETTGRIEPFIANFYTIGYDDPASLRYQNTDIPGNVDADRFTYAVALQYAINAKWTAEGFYERTNDIPDFPRGLLNDVFRDANDRLDNLMVDHITSFLYNQGALDAIPPYRYFNIFRERLVFRPEEYLKFTLHMAQNGYKFAAGIDDNVNHEGISAEYEYSKKLSFFIDYTHSRVMDVPKLINTNYSVYETRDHHNVYGSMDYKINPSAVLRSEYGVFGMGSNTPLVTPYSVTTFSLPTLDTERLFRVSLTGEF